MAGRKNPKRIEPRFVSGQPQTITLEAEERPADGRPRVPATPPPKVAPPKTGPAKRRRKPPATPKRGGRQRRRRSLFMRAVRLVVMFGIWVAIAGIGLVAYFAAELPGASEWRVPDRPPNIQILAVDGRLIGNRGDTGGEAVALAELPPYVPNAVIAIEDRRFRSHYGVDPIGLARAATKNIFAGGVSEGGSTLTQQLAKNMFLTPERSLKRKVQEAILSLWLESNYSKDQILEMYLNRVYFGSGAYGIEAAATRYFNVDARDLTLAQAATLAGVLPAPTRYAPNRNPDAARQRQALVLAAMTDIGFITPEEAKAARDAPLEASNYHANRSGNYIADWVMEVLPYHLGAIEQDVVVETTVDLDLQEAAEHAVTETLAEEGEKYGVGEGAMSVIDGTGAVRALVGGKDYALSQFNRAVEARRQPGSAFKPFVYLTAIEKLGYRPDTIMNDEPVTIGNWSPQNYDGKYRGPVMLIDALAHSINTVAAQLAELVTPESVVQTAKRMGINSSLGAVPSIALGTSEVSLLELTGAYVAFANGGYSVLPYVVQRIRTPSGDVLFDRSGSEPRRVLPIESVALMNYMLQATVEMGTGARAQFGGWPSGGKTGTSQNFRDAWFIGYTANLTAGVWVGNDTDAPTKHASGANVPAEIWAKFMKVAHQGVPVQQLPGTELVAYLLGQPPPTDTAAGPFEFGGGGTPEERAANEARSRAWLFGERPAPLEPQPQQPQERRGFFERLFGG
jgi:penicillin-binding protein 1A